MAEDQQQDIQEPESGSSTDGGGEVSVESLQAKIDELTTRIKALNHADGGKRKALERAEAEIAALKKAKQKDLADQGNYKALYEQTLRQANDARIQSIPEHMRSLVPANYSPEELATWLDNNQAVFSRPTPPDLGAGVAGGNGAAVKLTPQQLQVAKSFGMTAEQYAESLKKMGQ
jgi:chromosome segregation ATPase